MKPILSTVLLAAMALLAGAPKCYAQDCDYTDECDFDDGEYVSLYYDQSFDIAFDDDLLWYVAEGDAEIWVDYEDYGWGFYVKVTGVIYDPDPYADYLATGQSVDDSDASLEVDAEVFDSGVYQFMGDYFYCWDDYNWTEIDEWPSYDAAYLDPAGETSTWYMWDEEGGSEGGLFNPITLQGHGSNGAMAPGEDYSGKQAEEYIAGFSDGCWFQDSGYSRLTHADGYGDVWTISSDNTYGMDFINQPSGWFNYYAALNPFCTAGATQSMHIYELLTGPHPAPYAYHTGGVGLEPEENGIAWPWGWRDGAAGDKPF